MKSRKHDALLDGLVTPPVVDYADKEWAETLRTAIEQILNCTRDEAQVAYHSDGWEMWPEDDEHGMRYKANKILGLIGSRPATGAREDFLIGSGMLRQTDYVKVTEWGTEMSYTGSRYAKETSTSTIYHIDDLPERYKGWEIPCHRGNVQIVRLFSHGIGD